MSTGDRPHATAAILSIGDELILGQKLDTNAEWLSGRLAALGVRPVEHVTLDDDVEQIALALARLGGRADLVVVTGGLGPTADDLTREALARAMGDSLVEDEGALLRLEAVAKRRGREIGANRVQALRPSRAVCLDNEHGTAPGLWGTLGDGARGCDVVCLPGPPSENRPMFEGAVVPRLRLGGRVIAVRVLHTFGLPESEVGARLGALMERGRNPIVGTTASGGVVSCRVRFEGDAGEAGGAMERAVEGVRGAVGDHVFGEGEETLAEALVEALRERDARLVVAESCTGGLLGAKVTGVAGSSDVFVGGWQTYSNEMKKAALGVDGALVDDPAAAGYVGAVSAEVAGAMAVGALRAAPGGGAEFALAITGIAGPGGATAGKAVGTVFIALASRGGSGEARVVECRRFQIAGDRERVRDRSAMSALAMVWLHLRGIGVGRLTWEVG